MMRLFKNIGMLIGVRNECSTPLHGASLEDFPALKDASLLVGDDGRIIGYSGTIVSDESNDINESLENSEGLENSGRVEVIDLEGEWVFPSFCDSHTHLVYAGNRAGEFLDKINGLSYEDIARRGGGILNSADRLADTSEDDLYEQSMERVREVMAKGTGAIEIKSGYGLTLDSELKMLHVIRRIRESVPMVVKSTFLGAHAVGRAYAGRQADYVRDLCEIWMPEVAAQGLADFVDVFCDAGYFTPEETVKIIQAAARFGIPAKIHVNELAISGGVQAGVANGAISVDHLERTGEEEIRALASGSTIPTVLPGASFFLGMPYANAKGMIAADLPVAIASDYNPGSSPSGDMRFCCSLACINMKLTPAQALNAATINGAAAMQLEREVGSITPGKLANFYTTRAMPCLPFYLYAYSTPQITSVWLRGEKIER